MAAHLTDRVLPEVPIRQPVLTLLYPLRSRCAYDVRTTRASRAASDARGESGARRDGPRVADHGPSQPAFLSSAAQAATSGAQVGSTALSPK